MIQDEASPGFSAIPQVGSLPNASVGNNRDPTLCKPVDHQILDLTTFLTSPRSGCRNTIASGIPSADHVCKAHRKHGDFPVTATLELQ